MFVIVMVIIWEAFINYNLECDDLVLWYVLKIVKAMIFSLFFDVIVGESFTGDWMDVVVVMMVMMLLFIWVTRVR